MLYKTAIGSLKKVMFLSKSVRGWEPRGKNA